MKKQESSKIDMQAEFGLENVVTLAEQKAKEEEQYKAQQQMMIQAIESKMNYNRKIIKNMFNAEFFPRKGEFNTKPSMTIPDQTLPIREILARFAKGLPVGVNTPVYEGEDNDLPDPRTLDLVDLQNLKESITSEIKHIAKKVNTPKEKPKEEPKEESKPI